MIHSVLIVNLQGKVRLSQNYTPIKARNQQNASQPKNAQHELAQFMHQLIVEHQQHLASSTSVQNGHVLELPADTFSTWYNPNNLSSSNAKLQLVYRKYATLYFMIVADAGFTHSSSSGESVLCLLDLIQVMVSLGDDRYQCLFTMFLAMIERYSMI